MRFFTDQGYERILGVEMLDDGQGVIKEISKCKLVKSSKIMDANYKLVVVSKRSCSGGETQIYDSSKPVIVPEMIQFQGEQGFHVKLSKLNVEADDLISSTIEFCRGFCLFNLRHQSSFRVILVVKEGKKAELLLNVMPANNIITRA